MIFLCLQQEVSPRTSGRLSHSSGPLNGTQSCGSLTDSPPVSPSEIDDVKVSFSLFLFCRRPIFMVTGMLHKKVKTHRDILSRVCTRFALFGYKARTLGLFWQYWLLIEQTSFRLSLYPTPFVNTWTVWLRLVVFTFFNASL